MELIKEKQIINFVMPTLLSTCLLSVQGGWSRSMTLAWVLGLKFGQIVDILVHDDP